MIFNIIEIQGWMPALKVWNQAIIRQCMLMYMQLATCQISKIELSLFYAMCNHNHFTSLAYYSDISGKKDDIKA